VSAAETVAAARSAGVRLGLDGTDLLIESDREPLSHLLDALRRDKPEILALLRTRDTGELAPDEESNILAWLAYIKETDPAAIAEVVDKCRNDMEARRYFLKRSEEVPEQVTAR